MRNLMLALGAATMTVATMAMPVATAQAKKYTYRTYNGKYGKYQRRCVKSGGTTGAIAGGVAGALLGRTIDTRGDRTIGTVGGAAAGALVGRSVDRANTASRRCR